MDETRIQTVCLLLLSAVAAAFALYWLRPVMIPFVLALFFSITLAGLVNRGTERLRWPRAPVLALALVLGAGAAIALGVVVSIAVGQLSSNAAFYTQQAAELAPSLRERLPPPWAGLLPDQLPGLTETDVRLLGRLVAGTTNAVVDVLSRSFLVAVFALFLLLGSAAQPPEEGSLWADVEEQVTSYLLTKVAVSAATGLLVGLVLWLLDVPLALAFGLFAFLLNFIPNIGSIVATLLPLPVVVASPEISFGVAVAAIAIPGAIQMTIGNVVEPRLMGDALALHPVTVLLALIFWGMLWGIVGMLLAAPITAVMRILLAQLEPTRPLADLMTGRTEALRRARPRASARSRS